MCCQQSKTPMRSSRVDCGPIMFVVLAVDVVMIMELGGCLVNGR